MTIALHRDSIFVGIRFYINTNHAMKTNLKISFRTLCGFLAISATVTATWTGCFFSTKATSGKAGFLPKNGETAKEAKVFSKDGSVYLFNDGFHILQHSISGDATRYALKGPPSEVKVDLDFNEISSMTYYTKSQNAGTTLAELVGILYSPMLPLGLYCLACPKCCFGSCPTVYTPLGNKWALETECFNSSVSKLLEAPDLGRLSALPDSLGAFKLKITNEALETHFINRFNLIAARHPIGTKVLPTDKDGIVAIDSLSPPMRAVSRRGQDLREILARKDSNWYRSGSEMVAQFPETFAWDWIDLAVRVPHGKTSVTLALRQRNTLLSTILFYDVVLGSQGINALEWTKRLNTDTTYAAKFRKVYKLFSGLELQVKRNGEWKDEASFPDAGPLTWKEIAATVPVSPEDSVLELRLKFFPDNIMVDQVGFCFDADKIPVSMSEIPLDSVVDEYGNSGAGVKESIQKADSLYLETNPSDSYSLYYSVPPEPSEATTLFIQSQGYYTEWLRGNWIRQPDLAESFNLDDLPHTLRMLADSWALNREEIEQMFFQTRIPIREKL